MDMPSYEVSKLNKAILDNDYVRIYAFISKFHKLPELSVIQIIRKDYLSMFRHLVAWVDFTLDIVMTIANKDAEWINVVLPYVRDPEIANILIENNPDVLKSMSSVKKLAKSPVFSVACLNYPQYMSRNVHDYCFGDLYPTKYSTLSRRNQVRLFKQHPDLFIENYENYLWEVSGEFYRYSVTDISHFIFVHNILQYDSYVISVILEETFIPSYMRGDLSEYGIELPYNDEMTQSETSETSDSSDDPYFWKDNLVEVPEQGECIICMTVAGKFKRSSCTCNMVYCAECASKWFEDPDHTCAGCRY